MKRKTVFALIAVMILTMSETVYADGKTEPVRTETNGKSSSAETEKEEKSSVLNGCEAGQHQWSEWTVTIPADCVTEGQQIRNCEKCGISETASIAKTNEHDLKEISHQEATDDKDGFVLYACKRAGCSYQLKEVLSAKESSDTGEKEEKETILDSDSKAEDRSEENSPGESKNDGSDEISDKTNTEKDETEDIPDEDTDEGYASFAYATSSEIVAEYDPETAVSTRKVVRDSSDPSSAEEIEGMAVPENVMEVKRDADGNITDLAVSTTLEEIRNGFSFDNEARSLHSISIINEKDPSSYWITLRAEKQTSELGIRMKQIEGGISITLTENEKAVQIVKVIDDEMKLTLVTSTGGECVISKHIQKFELKGESKILKAVNEISLHDMNGQKPYVELTSVKKTRSEKSKKAEQNEEKDYWIQQYDDEFQTPVVITVYEN